MRYLTLTLLLACYANLNLTAQALSTVCDIQAHIILSHCFDAPGCLYLSPKIENGYLPYTYLWDTGSSNPSIGYGPNAPHVCHTVTITDARGCVAVASDSTTFESLVAGLAVPDTFWAGSTPINLDVSLNDNPDLVEFLMVQPPLHGSVTLNSDGSGQYTPDGTWCGPDYFRYVARINCKYTPIITSVILIENCANIVVTKSDCNAACDGEAYFYDSNVLPEPLTLQWSNGEQGLQAQQLCQGPVQVTVTDGLGNAHTYSAEIPGTLLEAGIEGPAEVCRGSSIEMDAQVLLEGEAGSVSYSWKGTGVTYQEWVQDYLTVSPYYPDSLHQFSLIVNSVLGCADTAFHQTYVHANPLIISVSQSLYYAGDTLSLSASVSGGAQPLTFIWTGPQGIFSDQPTLVWPDVDSDFSGSYRLKVVDQNGCYDTGYSNIVVRDSVSSVVNISNPSYSICANTDYRLDYVMQGGWVPYDALLWTGPNNFSSTEQFPVLENVQPEMTGMYYLTLTYGNQILRDSALFTFSVNSADIVSATLIPPTSCTTPTGGSLTLDIDAPGPFYFTPTWGGSGISAPNSPLVIPNLRPSTLTYQLQIRTGHNDACRTFWLLTIPYPDSISFQVTTACDGMGATVELIAVPPATQMAWHVPGHSFATDTVFRIENVPPGTYTTRVWGATGCQYSQYTSNGSFTVEPHLSFDVQIDQQPDCESSDGSLSVIWNEPPPQPLTYAWNNGADTPTNQQLSRGWYSVTVSDNTGCSNHKNVYLTADEICTPSISGRAFVNTDCFCAADSNYLAYSNLRVCATNGNYTDCTYTDNTGGYVLALSDPGFYELNIYPTRSYLEQNCTPYIFNINTANEQLTGQNIFLCGEPVHDAEIRGYCGTARPGFPYRTSFRVRNIGPLMLDTLTVSAVISPLIEVSQLIPAPLSFDPLTNEVTWRINAALPWQAYTDFVVEGLVIGALGDTVIHQGAVTTNANDVYPENNSFDCYTIITGSYDPNDKLVTPMGRGENGDILPNDSLLTYTIRFQNTGTDTAFTVVIRDTLDAAVFDLNSVQPVIASHPYRLDVEGEHILVFIFENIMLPDSGWSQQASQGYVVFNIALLEDLLLGTTISNSAAIYFDYNDPVITNVTLNTLTPTQEHLPEAFSWQLFPNPTAGNITTILSLLKPVRHLSFSLYNQQGICLVRQRQVGGLPPGDYAFPFDFSDWPSGIYLLQLQTEWGYATHKLILQH